MTTFVKNLWFLFCQLRNNILRMGRFSLHFLILFSYSFQLTADAFAMAVPKPEKLPFEQQDTGSYTIKVKRQLSSTEEGEKESLHLSLLCQNKKSQKEIQTAVVPLDGKQSLKPWLKEVMEDKISYGVKWTIKGMGDLLVGWDGTVVLDKSLKAGKSLTVSASGAVLVEDVTASSLRIKARDIRLKGDNNFKHLSVAFRPLGPKMLFGVMQLLKGSSLRTETIRTGGSHPGVIYNFGDITFDQKGQWDLNGNSLVNQGTINASSLAVHRGNHIQNTGEIDSKALLLEGNTIHLSGTLKTEALKTVSYYSFFNDSTVQTKSGLAIRSFGAFENRGTLQTEGDFDFYLMGRGKNTGSLVSSKKLKLGIVGILHNQKLIHGESGIDLHLGSKAVFLNDGSTLTQEKLALEGEGDVINYGLLQAENATAASSISILNKSQEKGLVIRDTFHFEGGELKNSGTLKLGKLTGTLTRLNNTGELYSNFDLSIKHFFNTCLLKGTGVLKATLFQNIGYLKGEGLKVRIDQEGENQGLMTLDALEGEGDFQNHGTLQLSLLDIRRLFNTRKEGTSVPILLKGETIEVGEHLERLENGEDGTISPDSLVFKKAAGRENTRTLINTGTIQTKHLSLQDDEVLNKGTLKTDKLEWNGTRFTNNMEGTVEVSQRTRLEKGSLINKGDMNFDNDVRVGLSVFENHGQFYLKKAFVGRVKHFLNASFIRTESICLGASEFTNEKIIEAATSIYLKTAKGAQKEKGTLKAQTIEMDFETSDYLDGVFEAEDILKATIGDDIYLTGTMKAKRLHINGKDTMMVGSTGTLIGEEESHLNFEKEFKNEGKALLTSLKLIQRGTTILLNMGEMVLSNLQRSSKWVYDLILESRTNFYQERILKTNILAGDFDTIQNQGTLRFTDSRVEGVRKVFNEGDLTFEGSSLSTRFLKNQGEIAFRRLQALRFFNILNDGVIKLQESLSIEKPESFDYYTKLGRIEAEQDLYLQLPEDKKQEEVLKQLPQVKGTLYLYAKHFVNPFDAKLHFLGNAYIDSQTFANGGSIKGRDIEVVTKEIFKNGQIRPRKTPSIEEQAKVTQNPNLQFILSIMSFHRVIEEKKKITSIEASGTLKVKAGEIDNTWGQLFGGKSADLEAEKTIKTGASIPKNQTIYYSTHTFHTGNGSFIATFGNLALKAPEGITNAHGQIISAGNLHMESEGTVTNLSGLVRTMGNGLVKAKAFRNTVLDPVMLYTGADTNGGGTWYVYHMCPKTGTITGSSAYHNGKFNTPQQWFPTSPQAFFTAEGTLELDVETEILNRGSAIHADEGFLEKKAKINNESITFPAGACLHRGNSWSNWQSYYSTVMTATKSSSKEILFDMPQDVFNSGVITAPRVEVREGQGSLQNGLNNGEERTTPSQALVTHYSMRDYVQDSHLSQGFFRRGRTREGYITPLFGRERGSVPHVTLIVPSQSLLGIDEHYIRLYSPLLEEMVLQRSFMDRFRRGFFIPHLTLRQQYDAFIENAVGLSEGRGYITEEEAEQTKHPLLVHRPETVDGEKVLVPELYVPQNTLKDPVLKAIQGNEGVIAAEDSLPLETRDVIKNTGTMISHEISTRSDTLDVEKRTVVRQGDNEKSHSDELQPGGTIVTFPKTVRDEQDHEVVEKGSLESKHRHILLQGALIDSSQQDLHATEKLQILPKQVRSHSEDKDTKKDSLTNHRSVLNGDNLKHTSEGTIDLQAAQYRVTQSVNIEGKKGVNLSSAQDQSHSETHSKEGNPLTGGEKRDEVHQQVTHQVVEITNPEGGKVPSVTIRSGEGSIPMEAPLIRAEDLEIEAAKKVIITVVKDIDAHSRQETSSNAILNQMINEGEQRTIVKQTQIDADRLRIAAQEGIEVQLRQNSLDQDTEFVKQLRSMGATLTGVSDDIKTWKETHHSLGQGLSTLIAIGVSMMMPGLGTGVSGAMLTAGAKSLTTQALIGLVNNGGDPLKTLKDLTSGESLRNTLVSVATVGVSQQLSRVLEIPLHPESIDFAEHLQSSMLQTVSSLSVESILSQKDLSEVIRDSLKLGAANLIGSYGASQIGTAFKEGTIDAFSQKMAHAALGAASAALMKGEPVAGAIGAVVGEIAGDLYREEMEKQGRFNPSTTDFEKIQERGVDIARFTTAAIATLLNQDAEAAALTAGNAARYNALSVFGGRDLENLQKDTKRLVDELKEGVESFREAGRELGEAVGSTIEEDGIIKDGLGNMGADLGTVVGIGLNVISIGERGGKNVKAPRKSVKVSQLQQNKISGKEFQTPVHEWLRISENKKAYSVVVQGKGTVTTIPDLPLQYGVTDIKNVKYITNTKQLQAQASLAEQQKTSFNLIISPKTEKISIPVSRSIRNNQGKIFEFDPVTETMIERFLNGNMVIR
jgi:adhesin HecA-like repeat protein